MNKPMSIVRMEFITELTKLINNCGLPPFVIEPIIKDIFNEIKIATNDQYRKDMYNYEKFLNENIESNNKKGDDD